MAVWHFLLECSDPKVLEGVARVTAIPDFKAVSKEDHWYIEVDRLAPDEAAKNAKERARKLLRVATNVYGAQIAGGIDPVEVGDITHVIDDDGTKAVIVHARAADAMADGYVVTASDGSKVAQPRPTTIAEFAAAFADDDDVQRAIAFLNDRSNRHVNLYQAFEIVDHHVSSRRWGSLGWVSGKRQINRFTMSMQPERHAYFDSHPEPMDEDEAYHFMRSIIQRWLTMRYEEMTDSPFP